MISPSPPSPHKNMGSTVIPCVWGKWRGSATPLAHSFIQIPSFLSQVFTSAPSWQGWGDATWSCGGARMGWWTMWEEFYTYQPHPQREKWLFKDKHLRPGTVFVGIHPLGPALSTGLGHQSKNTFSLRGRGRRGIFAAPGERGGPSPGGVFNLCALAYLEWAFISQRFITARAESSCTATSLKRNSDDKIN